jgi:hypothetical protein
MGRATEYEQQKYTRGLTLQGGEVGWLLHENLSYKSKKECSCNKPRRTIIDSHSLRISALGQALNQVELPRTNDSRTHQIHKPLQLKRYAENLRKLLEYEEMSV